MDGFEHCDIRYLTAASLQQWREAPALWALKHLFGIHSYKCSAVAKAIALKDGLRYCMHNQNERAGEDIALGVYERKLEEWGIDLQSPSARSDHDSLLPSLQCHVQEIQRRGLLKKPLAFAVAKHVWIEDIEVPFLSVVDFVFEEVQLKVKFGGRCPSTIQPRDIAAMSVDADVRFQRPAILYGTMKKVGWFEPDHMQLRSALQRLRAEAMALQTLLKTAESREQVLAMLPINHYHYQWRPDLLEAATAIVNTYQEKQRGLICTEGRGLPERPARIACGDLLPDSGSWDSEVDL